MPKDIPIVYPPLTPEQESICRKALPYLTELVEGNPRSLGQAQAIPPWLQQLLPILLALLQQWLNPTPTPAPTPTPTSLVQ